MSMRRFGVRGFGCFVVGLLMLAVFGCDKAKAGYEECKQLEASGKLAEAEAVCEGANLADPETDFGKLAVSEAVAIQVKLDEIVPPTVTTEWCGRLRRRLQSRLSADAAAKLGGAGGDVGTMIADFVLNTENNCRDDAGKPTAGLWLCRWNEGFDDYPQCDGLGSR
jgi:hypothetical protein